MYNQIWSSLERSLKAFDSINHNLLIAKLDAYESEKQSIDFLHSYLTKRNQE